LFALAGVAASGQAQPPPASDLLVDTKMSVHAPQDGARAREMTPPAPRGDLRGDIASNARVRPDNERETRAQHH
jgi:hypothetical protein